MKNSLGMFGLPPALFEQGRVAIGVKSAIDGFLSALLRHGSNPVHMFCAPTDRHDILHDLARRSRFGAKRVGVHTYHELFDRFDDFQIAAWHHPWNEGARAFRLRSLRAAGLYPITIIDHCASYQRFQESYFLPIVLADTQSCDAIVCLSRSHRSAVQKTFDFIRSELRNGGPVRRASGAGFRGQFPIIPVGVDTGLFRPQEKRGLRRRLGLPLEALIVLYGGRLSFFDKADLLPLLLAFKDVTIRHSKRNIILVIAGTDRWQFKRMMQHFAKEIGIRGKIIFRNLEPAHLTLAAADVYVSPVDSVQEAGGLTPIEAMACGTPQIVSDWDGYRDTVIHGQTGFLVPTWWARCDSDPCRLAMVAESNTFTDHLELGQSVAVDVPALCDALDTLISNDDLRKSMADRSRERAVAEFSWPVMIQRLEELWLQLVEIARKTQWKPRAAPCYPRFFDRFSSYSSNIVVGNALLTITPRGARVVEGKEVLPAYLSGLGALDFDLIERALMELAAARSNISLQKLARSLTMGTKITEDRAVRHLMWLIKYDLAKKI